MFDMKQIGKKITDLRKSHNMTQMELADKLAISFQAVSNWERGDSIAQCYPFMDEDDVTQLALRILRSKKK